MNSNIIDEFVTDMLTRHNILSYRNLLSTPEYSKQSMPNSLEQLIHPFTLTEDELKIRPGVINLP